MSSSIEEIKNRIDIVEFIGSYLRLQKAGVNFKAPCPFHNEKTPSFVVSPARQIWHCFGCAKGGDIFRFLMEIEGLDFPEALRALADRAGIELKREDSSLRTERNRQISMLEEAASFFEANLQKESTPLDYLTKRGVQKETIKEWRIGFASNEWENLAKHLSSKGFNGEEIERAGLAIKSQASAQSRTAEARYYDRFRGRIMFPIFDYQGRVVAFGGRMYPDRENEAKYINSPETALYQKSKILYGLDKAKTHVLKSGACVIVEGYMDTIMSWQAGVKNVIASSGTALSLDQLKILRRLCEKIVAAFDMDIAGQAATKRGIEIALKDGFNVSVIDLGDVKDPADAVVKSPNIWTKEIESARHIVQFYIDKAIQKYKADTPM
ncbi:MAG: DNA primase, partial [Patescibacteria group bacterium]